MIYLLVFDNIANGAGLSFSASLEMLIGIIIPDLFELNISKTHLAKLG